MAYIRGKTSISPLILTWSGHWLRRATASEAETGLTATSDVGESARKSWLSIATAADPIPQANANAPEATEVANGNGEQRLGVIGQVKRSEAIDALGSVHHGDATNFVECVEVKTTFCHFFRFLTVSSSSSFSRWSFVVD